MIDISKNSLSIDLLVVDDSPVNLRLLSEMLQQQGYNVRKAMNGEMAFIAIQTKIPDLILLDINMPDIDGYQVCEKLKAKVITRDIPIIFISAFNEPFDKVKAFNIGGADYITKPFAFEEVFARVKHQLELKRLHEKLCDRNQQLQENLTQFQRIIITLLKLLMRQNS